MKQEDLVKAVAAEAGVSQAEANSVLKALAKVAQTAVKVADDIYISGFGRVRVVKTKDRVGRNPRTGEPIQIPAKNRVTFVVSKSLKDTANG